MQTRVSSRGFTFVMEEKYQNERGEYTRLISESSAIANDGKALDNPGSSFLWVGADHHLNKDQVAELIGKMQHWLDTGKLPN